MNRWLLGGLSTLVLTGAMIPGIQAQAMTPVDSSFYSMATKHGMDLKPFNLVFLAYQGFLESEGIPMAGALINGFDAGKVTSKDLVQAAVKMGRLPADTVNDTGYLSSVDSQLKALVLGSR